MARMPVGEVTLISVRLPSITSMPVNNSPRRLSSGPMGELRIRRRTAAHHVGAQVVRRRDAIDRAGIDAVHQNDALVAMFHGGQEFLHHPGFAERRCKHVVERTEIEVIAGDAEHRAATVAVERLHHDVVVFVAERFDLGKVAREHRRRHQFGVIQHEHFFRRVADFRRIVDDQRLGVDALKKMRRGDVIEIERRVLPHQHGVE